MEGKARICGMELTADRKEVTWLPSYSGSSLLQSLFGFYGRLLAETSQLGGHQEQLPTMDLVVAEGAITMTLPLLTNTVRRPSPRQLHPEPPGQLLLRRKKAGDQAFGQEPWEVLPRVIWRATEDRISNREVNRQGTLMGRMVVVTGKGVQFLAEPELGERHRVKLQVRILAMAPADTKVLALEEQVGDNQILRDFRFIFRSTGGCF